jgi:hypothetical protein
VYRRIAHCFELPRHVGGTQLMYIEKWGRIERATLLMSKELAFYFLHLFLFYFFPVCLYVPPPALSCSTPILQWLHCCFQVAAPHVQAYIGHISNSVNTLITLATQWFWKQRRAGKKKGEEGGVEGIFHMEHFLKHSMWKGKTKGKEDGLQNERIFHLANHFLKHSTWQWSSINKGNKGQCFRSLDWLFPTFSPIFHWTWAGKQLEVWMNM